MRSSRVMTAVAFVALLTSGCGAPSNGPTTQQVLPQSNTISGTTPSGVDGTASISPQESRRLYWRPDHIVVHKGAKKPVKLFFEAGLSVRLADDCTGRVAIGQIGFARIKKYRINVYDALALRSGPFHCGVIAKVDGEPLHAVLHVAVAP